MHLRQQILSVLYRPWPLRSYEIRTGVRFLLLEALLAVLGFDINLEVRLVLHGVNAKILNPRIVETLVRSALLPSLAHR